MSALGQNHMPALQKGLSALPRHEAQTWGIARHL
jgi:hypothetical protein